MLWYLGSISTPDVCVLKGCVQTVHARIHADVQRVRLVLVPPFVSLIKKKKEERKKERAVQ